MHDEANSDVLGEDEEKNDHVPSYEPIYNGQQYWHVHDHFSRGKKPFLSEVDNEIDDLMKNFE